MAQTIYVTLAEALEILGISRKTMYRWLEQGRIQSHQPGGFRGRQRFKRSELERVLEGRTVKQAQ